MDNINVKVCLINPPSPWLKKQNAFPPLGLLYLGASLLAKDMQIEIIDHALDCIIPVEKPLTWPDADLYGITSTTPQYTSAKIIKLALQSINQEAKVVLGGSHATYAMNGNSDDFDMVFKGDSEISLDWYIGHYMPKFFPTNPITQPIVLDILPKPARNLVNLHDYKYFIGKENLPATTIITSRGCPYSCAFCAKADNHVRFHSAEYVCEEIDEIKDVYGFDNLLFLDDCFSIKKERLIRILAHTKKRNIKFRCYIRSDTQKHILDLLKESGCVEVGMGIESGSQLILNNVSKKTSVSRNIETVKYCEKIGIPVNAFLMIGLPGETEKTAEETIELVKQAKPTKFGYNIYIPYPGSDIFNNIKDYDIKIHDMPNDKAITKGTPGDIKSFVSTASLSRDKISDLFHQNFYDLVEITGWNPEEGKFA